MSEERNITFLCGQCCNNFGVGEMLTLGWFTGTCEACNAECEIKNHGGAGFVRTTEEIQLRVSMMKAFDSFYQEKIAAICDKLGISEFTARMTKPTLSFNPHLPPVNLD